MDILWERLQLLGRRLSGLRTCGLAPVPKGLPGVTALSEPTTLSCTPPFLALSAAGTATQEPCGSFYVSTGSFADMQRNPTNVRLMYETAQQVTRVRRVILLAAEQCYKWGGTGANALPRADAHSTCRAAPRAAPRVLTP